MVPILSSKRSRFREVIFFLVRQLISARGRIQSKSVQPAFLFTFYETACSHPPPPSPSIYPSCGIHLPLLSPPLPLVHEAAYHASPFLVELGRRKNVEKDINSEEESHSKTALPAPLGPSVQAPSPLILYTPHILTVMSKSGIVPFWIFCTESLLFLQIYAGLILSFPTPQRGNTTSFRSVLIILLKIVIGSTLYSSDSSCLELLFCFFHSLYHFPTVAYSLCSFFMVSPLHQNVKSVGLLGNH